MKPEYIGYGNFDLKHYVYAVCMCPTSTAYAIKFNRIQDGEIHSYQCVCENCKTKIKVIG